MHRLQFFTGDEWSDEAASDFLYHVIGICEEHRRQGRALLFAFLLYSYKDPEIEKVLHDRDYWTALDHAAGRYLTVFVINSPLHDISDPADNWHPDVRSETRATLEFLRAGFGAGDAVTIPCMYLFQVKDREVVDGLSAPLSPSSVEEAYAQMRAYIDATRDALKNVKEEYKDNAQEVFNLVAQEVWSVQAKATLHRWSGKVSPLTAIIGLFARLAQ